MVDTAPTPFEIEHTSPAVLTVKVPLARTSEAWFLLRSDAHHDNPHCRWDLEKRHLDEVVARRAGIIDVGDLFCAMQGKYDKRSDKSTCRPEHQCTDYLDALVRTAADFYEPYAHNWLIMGQGNHETAVQNRHETNLTERLVSTLNDRTGSHVKLGGYTGWVRFQLTQSTKRASRKLWWIHGYGGGGPVTMDTIQAQRQRGYIENADVMVSGHTHDAWALDTIKLRLNNAGAVERRVLWQIKTPTYKDEYADGAAGWHVQTGKPPKPLGAFWIRLTWPSIDGPEIEVHRAQ